MTSMLTLLWRELCGTREYQYLKGCHSFVGFPRSQALYGQSPIILETLSRFQCMAGTLCSKSTSSASLSPTDLDSHAGCRKSASYATFISVRDLSAGILLKCAERRRSSCGVMGLCTRYWVLGDPVQKLE